MVRVESESSCNQPEANLKLKNVTDPSMVVEDVEFEADTH